MEITTTCPACGSQINLSTSFSTVTCDFCGTRYDVDLSQTEPVLRHPSSENAVDEKTSAQLAETKNGSSDPPQPLFEPALPNEPPSAPISAVPVTPTRRNNLWLTVMIAVMAVVCGLCACMVLLVLVYNFSAR
jgi:hypothetical protein